ncbi:MAG: UDP-N-acetylmuramoyl-tripeptide--D-alanyl-D-alanine ligase [bacterium]|nr:UDP-N-acetylmuramoyl-tripeptide--D-alanyl-D-alanine ligase [bacterium]
MPNPLKLIAYHLYLFQLENYRIRRYFAILQKQYPWKAPAETRKKLVWTLKASYLFLLALILQILLALAVSKITYALLPIPRGIANTAGLITFAGLFWLFPFLLAGAMFLYYPTDRSFKKSIIRRAQKKMREFPNLIIIGITGSYGKTTMKETIATMLSQKFHVLKTPENINTPLGISRLILEKLNPGIQILVAEMGAYERSDIRALCDIIQPQIAVLTGINEAHLERFGSLEETTAAKFEIVDSAKPDGIVLLNADDTRVMKEYRTHTDKRKTYFYSGENHPMAQTRISEIRFFEDGSGIGFELATGSDSLGYIKVPFLGEYITGIVGGAALIAKELGMTKDEIRRGIAGIMPIPHRLQAIKKEGGVLIIDDSYNGNPDGVKEALKTLARFKGRRTIYVTPGLVETGVSAEAVHREIGKELAKSADRVVLIRNSVTPFIAEELLKNGFPQEHIIWFDTAPETYKKIPEIMKSGDVVLFQNDWPENYF